MVGRHDHQQTQMPRQHQLHGALLRQSRRKGHEDSISKCRSETETLMHYATIANPGTSYKLVPRAGVDWLVCVTAGFASGVSDASAAGAAASFFSGSRI